MITKTTMVVIFNLQNSHLLTLSLPTEEVFQVNGQNRPVANLPVVDRVAPKASDVLQLIGYINVKNTIFFYMCCYGFSQSRKSLFKSVSFKMCLCFWLKLPVVSTFSNHVLTSYLLFTPGITFFMDIPGDKHFLLRIFTVIGVLLSRTINWLQQLNSITSLWSLRTTPQLQLTLLIGRSSLSQIHCRVWTYRYSKKTQFSTKTSPIFNQINGAGIHFSRVR